MLLVGETTGFSGESATDMPVESGTSVETDVSENEMGPSAVEFMTPPGRDPLENYQ